MTAPSLRFGAIKKDVSIASIRISCVSWYPDGAERMKHSIIPGDGFCGVAYEDSVHAIGRGATFIEDTAEAVKLITRSAWTVKWARPVPDPGAPIIYCKPAGIPLEEIVLDEMGEPGRLPRPVIAADVRPMAHVHRPECWITARGSTCRNRRPIKRHLDFEVASISESCSDPLLPICRP